MCFSSSGLPALKQPLSGECEEPDDFIETEDSSTDDAFGAFLGDDVSDEDSDGSSSTFSFQSSTDMNSLIYEGAQITLGVSMLLVITFATRHSITSEGISELLQLLILHYNVSNCLPRTLYGFQQFFKDVQHPLK